MKIQIIYIATNDYIGYLDGFTSSIGYFFEGYKKNVTILSNKDIVSLPEVENVDFNTIHILDLMYPSFNLNKNYIVNQVIDDTCDYIFYFDADTKFIKNSEYKWKRLINLMNDNSVLLTSHPFYSMTDNAKLWGQTKVQLISNLFTKNLTEKEEWSSAYIPFDTYTYVNSAFFAAKTDVMRHFNERIISLIKMDLKRHFMPEIQQTYHIPQFIDENYFNAMYTNKLYTEKDNMKFICEQYSKLYNIDSLDIDTIFMYQKNMDDFKTNRQ